jgi:transposase
MNIPTFSKEDLAAIDHARFNHPDPQIQRRMEVLNLIAASQAGITLTRSQIAILAGVCENSLRTYVTIYLEKGVEGVKEISRYRPKSDLEEHRDSIEESFRKVPPVSISEAIDRIEKLTGIKRKPTQVRIFLKSIGMNFRKVGTVPSKADPDEQEAFKSEQLEPRIEEAKAGRRALLFMDAAHFVLSAYLGYLWCFARIFIKTPSGRQRFNVLGALDAISHELLTVTNVTYINAQSVCELLQKIAAHYVGVPITIVLDNARYQKCAIVTELAASLNIELLYLPPYSPNLNIIERLWKFVKKECLYSKYYEKFSEFKFAISECLAVTHTKHKDKLSSLLALHFQKFKKAQIVPA